MANLSHLVGFALTVTTRYKKETSLSHLYFLESVSVRIYLVIDELHYSQSYLLKGISKMLGSIFVVVLMSMKSLTADE